MRTITHSLAIAASLLGAPAFAWEATAGRPYEGQTVNVLAVKSSQFEAQEARLAAFEEATGIDVVYDYVPFPNMKEALTTEMVAGGGDYDVVSIMDQWVPSLQMLLQPIGDEIAAQGVDLADFPKAHLRHGMLNGELVGLPVRGHVQLMFYRTDLFEAAGVEPPQTWEDMVTVARAIQGSGDAAGVALPYGKLNGQNLMVWMNGANIKSQVISFIPNGKFSLHIIPASDKFNLWHLTFNKMVIVIGISNITTWW